MDNTKNTSKKWLALMLLIVVSFVFVKYLSEGDDASIFNVSSDTNLASQRDITLNNSWDSAENIAFGQVHVLSDADTSGYYKGLAKVSDIYDPCDCPAGASCEPCEPGTPLAVTLVFEKCYCGINAECKPCSQNDSITKELSLSRHDNKLLPQKDNYYVFLFEKSSAPLTVRVLDYESEK